MNNVKKLIKNPLIVLIIAALVGGFFGSYFTYYLNNLSTENRNKEITKQLMLFIHNEIYQNYAYKFQGYRLLDVEGLDLMNLRESNLTIKDEQLSYLIKMYGHFRIYNFKVNEIIKSAAYSPWWMKEFKSKDLQDWEDICMQEIQEYEKEFCKNKSLKSEIGVKFE